MTVSRRYRRQTDERLDAGPALQRALEAPLGGTPSAVMLFWLSAIRMESMFYSNRHWIFPIYIFDISF